MQFRQKQTCQGQDHQMLVIAVHVRSTPQLLLRNCIIIEECSSPSVKGEVQ